MTKKQQLDTAIGEFEGREIFGGDCWIGMPAVYMEGIEFTDGRYPESMEEWKLYGAHLPDEITVIKDIEIGCDNYQALLASGIAIRDCTRCPYRDIGHSE